MKPDSGNDLCQVCSKSTCSPKHIFLLCDDKNIGKLRHVFYDQMKTIYHSFSKLNNDSKLFSILNLQKIDDDPFNDKFVTLCITYVKDVMKAII